MIDPDRPDAFKLAETLRNEFCIRVTGRRAPRRYREQGHGLGGIGVFAHEIRIYNASDATVRDGQGQERQRKVRLKYRYLDLRRPQMAKNLLLRARVSAAARESPQQARLRRYRNAVLYKSTPEGAREFLVPSAHPRRPVLRAAAVAAVVQAAPDGGGLRTATTRSSSASATKTCAPTASPSSRRSTSRPRSRPVRRRT